MLGLFSAAPAHDFKLCSSTDHAKFTSVTLAPDPPVHGQDLVVTLNGTPDIDVSAGKVIVGVTVYGIPVPGTPTYDICKDVGLTCPIKAGTAITPKVSYGINSKVPAGIDATVKLTIEDGSGTEISCVSLDAKISGSNMLSDVEGELSHLNPFASRRLTGGWAEQAEFGPSSRAHRLAAFALKELQSASDDESFKGAALDRVTEYRTQVVSGTNHEIVAKVGAGSLTLRIYEQVWTNALQVTSATLSAPVSDVSMAVVTTPLISDEPLALDAAKFSALEQVEEKVEAKPEVKAEVKPPLSALAKLLQAPQGSAEAELKAQLAEAYAEQPDWHALFDAWRAQHKKPPYPSAAEEGRRFAAFKQSVLRLQAAGGKAPGGAALANEHSDKTLDELKSFAHFA